MVWQEGQIWYYQGLATALSAAWLLPWWYKYLRFPLWLSIVWMKTHTEQKLFLRACYFSQPIFSWVVNDNIVSVIKCVCLSQFWLTLCQSNIAPFNKIFHIWAFCGQNFWSVATTVHLLLSSLAVHYLSLECLSNKHPLINQYMLSNQDSATSIFIRGTVFWTLTTNHSINQGPYYGLHYPPASKGKLGPFNKVIHNLMITGTLLSIQ